MNANNPSKFKILFRRLTVLGNFVTIQSCALLYSRKDDHSLTLMIVFFLSLLLTFGLYFYWTRLYKGFSQYCRRQYWIHARNPRTLKICALMIGVVTIQFLLPGNIDYYIQNILYVISFMYLICMSILFYVIPQIRK